MFASATIASKYHQQKAEFVKAISASKPVAGHFVLMVFKAMQPLRGLRSKL